MASLRTEPHALPGNDEADAQLMLSLELVQLARDAVVNRLGGSGQVVLDVRDDNRYALERPLRALWDQIRQDAELLEQVRRRKVTEQRFDRPVAGVRAPERISELAAVDLTHSMKMVESVPAATRGAAAAQTARFLGCVETESGSTSPKNSISRPEDRSAMKKAVES